MQYQKKYIYYNFYACVFIIVLGDLNSAFPYHDPNFPAISEMKVNPFTTEGNGTDTASGKPTFEKRMIRAHGK